MQPKFEFEIGEEVFDDLTGKKVSVIGLTYQTGRKYGEMTDHLDCIAYWVNHKYLGGGRHPWELTKLSQKNLEQK